MITPGKNKRVSKVSLPNSYYKKLMTYVKEEYRDKRSFHIRNATGISSAIMNLLDLVEQKEIVVRVVSDFSFIPSCEEIK